MPSCDAVKLKNVVPGGAWSRLPSQATNGPVRTETPFVIRPPRGEAYGAVEGPKGELGFYIVSDNGISPYRLKVRAPSFINLTALRDMVVGGKMGDLIIVFGSLDIVLGEVDR